MKKYFCNIFKCTRVTNATPETTIIKVDDVVIQMDEPVPAVTVDNPAVTVDYISEDDVISAILYFQSSDDDNSTYDKYSYDEDSANEEDVYNTTASQEYEVMFQPYFNA